MTFIRKTKPEKTCKDFKSSFWDRNRCKLTGICADAGGHIPDTFSFCTGIEYSELESPPQGGSGVPNKSGHGVKPKIKRPKPKSRPRKKIKIGLVDLD